MSAQGSDTSGATELVTQGGVGGAAAAPAVTLVAYHRHGAAVFPLERGKRVVLGRTPPAELVVPDKSLSRQHARFGLLGDEVVVEDLGSTNGTWLDGKAVTKQVLRAGNVVMLGTVRVVVQALGGRPRLGLAGHDAFRGQLERELDRARHFGRPATLLMMKSPDRGVAIHEWAQVVGDALRKVDVVALYGGDVVEALLPETTAVDGGKLARRVERAVTATSLRIGMATFPDAGTTAEHLLDAARGALRATSLDQPIAVAPSTMVSKPSTSSNDDVVAESEAMVSLLGMAKRVAKGNIPVLLHGETGTGKEVVANYIHEQGPRRAKPLVAVNCAAIPAQLVESTLFGHVKGAFTGAEQAREGVFEAAHGGTVLLDEIGELPAAAQAALLRVLESKTVNRVGATKEKEVDVRIVAASHRDLAQMVAQGTFREDLLYRLNAVTLKIPPLRERHADVAPLVARFLQSANESNGTAISGFAPEAMARLAAHDWPGNIRELRNTVERAVVIAEHDVIGLEDLPSEIAGLPPAPPAPRPPSPSTTDAAPTILRGEEETFRECMERLEVQVLLQALVQADGNQAEAARRLSMPRRTIVHKIKVLGIKREDYLPDEEEDEQEEEP